MVTVSIGTFTNSAVVGLDNSLYGGLPDLAFEHDVPCRDIALRRINFESVDPFTLVPAR